jgi:coenzyme F420-dependent glucose-6-phosphate dehydrogenase
MPVFGYTLSSEEHGPSDLVTFARRAEESGFEFLSLSDHYHPWTTAQGHSPFSWAILGALSRVTERVRVGVGVACPIMRLHPAIVAQATATTSLLFEGRFFCGVGTGKALNEHVVARRWPRLEIRLEMLEEAVSIIRALWAGDTLDHRGRHFEVENARLFDAPAASIPIIVSGFGIQAAQLAGRIGDGYWGTAPERELLAAFEDAGGRGPRYAQLTLCWAADADEAKKTVREYLADRRAERTTLPRPADLDPLRAATEPLTVEQVTEHTACGPNIAADVVGIAREYLAAGYDHLYFHQIGRDQDGFFNFWDRELRASLAML